MKAQSPSFSIRTTPSKRRVVALEDKPHWTKAAVRQELKSLADPRVRAKMGYFGDAAYLYAHAKPAWSKVSQWSRRPEEFEKRAAFSLIAYLSYKDKAAPDARFVRFLRVIEREAATNEIVCEEPSTGPCGTSAKEIFA